MVDIKCPRCAKELEINVSTENIVFFVQNCPYCSHEFTAVLKNFKIVGGQVFAELIKKDAVKTSK